MTVQNFVKLFYPYALETQKKTGMSALAILAQAALESGWGNSIPGNMFFGVKDTDGINGNEQLLTTTEYSASAKLKFPVIIWVKQVLRGGKKIFQYRIKDWFRKYKTPEECFTDHANFLIRNKRYAAAIKVKADPVAFIKAIAAAGYATDPEYANKLISIMNTIKKFI